MLDRIGYVLVDKRVGDNWFVVVLVVVGRGKSKNRVMVGVRYCIDLDIDFEMVDDSYYPVN